MIFPLTPAPGAFVVPLNLHGPQAVGVLDIGHVAAFFWRICELGHIAHKRMLRIKVDAIGRKALATT